MVLYKNELREIFRSRTYGEKKILTWRGMHRIKLLDKSAALHDIWDAFCREFDEQRQFLETEVSRMRQQIEAEKEKSDADLVDSAPGYIIQELRVLFREFEKELEDQPTPMSDAPTYVLEKIRQVLEQDFDEQMRIVDQMEKGSREQMERLSRRLERTAKDLELSEDEVARLRRELAIAYDGGVASIYKTVQGLSAEETNYKAKQNLLSKLFESNVEIRKHLKPA